MDNFSLLVDLYELTMAECYLSYKPEARATFDLFVRELPLNRSYLIACGINDILTYLNTLRFNDQGLDYLRKQKIFSDDFLGHLRRFKFKGDIWAMPEGSVFFAQEPVLRVTAPIIEAQIIESFLLNTINLQAMIASKASRVVCAAEGKKAYDFSLRRTHGYDAGIKVARSSYLAGFNGTSNVLAGKLYNIPIVGTMAHSFVMSFRHELDGFLAYSHIFPDQTILLVDTYDTKKGIENAVKIGIYLESRGFRLKGIRLDSGDIVLLSKLARKMLDKAGLNYVKILASGNLDEFKIKQMLSRGACVDSFGVGTNMGTSQDAPSLDAVYKISEVTNEDGEFLPTMKLSKGKITYPGRKQVFRIKSKAGRFLKDVLGLEEEKINGRPLLIKAMDKGRIVYKARPLEEIRKSIKDDLAAFPDQLSDIHARYKYPVEISPRLKKLRASLLNQLKKRQ